MEQLINIIILIELFRTIFISLAFVSLFIFWLTIGIHIATAIDIRIGRMTDLFLRLSLGNFSFFKQRRIPDVRFDTVHMFGLVLFAQLFLTGFLQPCRMKL